jgi:hypothetical protein
MAAQGWPVSRWAASLWAHLPGRRTPKLDAPGTALLAALHRGHHLKVHRTVDGAKVYRLHCAGTQTAPQELPGDLVESLERGGYLQSNMKFPAATLLLTEKGCQATRDDASAGAQGTNRWIPVGPRHY